MRRIVVGVDGSQTSAAALRWGVDEARLHEAMLDVVLAWSYPPMTSITGIVPPPAFADDDLEAAARATLEAMLDGLDTSGVELTRHVVHGRAAESLLGAAKGADLLVVGSRGRGGFSGLLLGSVSQQCAHHADCPVVIVRNGTG
jgi:nucleotide-binding universal stress UspA family protein